MAQLEELTSGASVRGILPDGLVTVVNVQWFGSAALELTFKDAAGRLGNQILYRENEPSLEIATVGRPWSFDGDGAMLRPVSEAMRLRLAYLLPRPGRPQQPRSPAPPPDHRRLRRDADAPGAATPVCREVARSDQRAARQGAAEPSALPPDGL